MPLSRARDYLSIGEVLEEVRKEFPDVSISKIRFLEAEGLIEPERTNSGYRKFFEKDVQRLRYILSLQRDQFLPLRVIRERLDQVEANGSSYPAPTQASAGSTARPGDAPAPPPDMSGIELSRSELRDAAGLSEAQLQSLEDFGILSRRDGDVYDEDDLVAARSAASMFGYGIEARHLRMFRQFADREVTFYQQLVAPIARRGKDDADRSVKELATLSRRLHEALLRSSIRELL